MPENYKAKIKWANYLRKKAVTRSALTGQSTLNYAKAIKYDKGKTKDRRKFVAGFQMAGGHVTRISKRSQKAVNAYKISNQVVYKELPKNPFGVPYCQGSNKMVKYKKSNYNYRWYRDSCKTALIIAVLGSVTLVAGIVTVCRPSRLHHSPRRSPPSARLVTVAVDYMRDTSKLNAVWIRMRVSVGLGGEAVVSRQAKVNIIATVIAMLGFVVLGIAYSRGGLIMIYVLPFILALCAPRLVEPAAVESREEGQSSSPAPVTVR